MRITHTLLLPRDVATVPAVRRLCRTAMADLGVIAADIDDVTLALTEACSNVVEHAAACEVGYQVDISISVTQCEITVVDCGEGFDPSGAEFSFDATGEAEHGRGLALMRSLVDVAELRSAPRSGTVVHLVKHLTLGEDAMLRRIAERTGEADPST